MEDQGLLAHSSLVIIHKGLGLYDDAWKFYSFSACNDFCMSC